MQYIQLPKYSIEISANQFENQYDLQLVKNSIHISSIRENAFRNCSSLISIDIRNTETIGDNAFENCTNLSSIIIKPNIVLPKNCFKNCYNLTNVKNLNFISAFYNTTFYNSLAVDYSRFQKYIIRSHSKDDLKVALCTIAKLENRYIREFIEYYKVLGIDKIYLYDTNPPNTENFHDVIGDYIDSGFVEHIVFNEGHQITQEVLDAYNDCYSKHGFEYDWICFFDPDEYLTIEYHKDIKEYLSYKAFDPFQVIHINWLTYDDNDLLEDDGRDLNARFTRECESECVKTENERIKSIVRGGLNNIEFSSPHTPNTDNGHELIVCNNCANVVPNTFKNSINYNLAYLKHFRCKTIQEYVDNKLPKLSLAGYQNLVFDDDFFFTMNTWSEEKQKIFDEHYKKFFLKDYNSNRRKYKYSVLTVITGNDKDDTLKDPKFVDPDVEYICVTDRLDIKSNKWKIVTLKKPFRDMPISKWKYPKFHPFEFVHSDVCVYIDSTIQILNDFHNLIDAFVSEEYDLGFMPHPNRCNVFDEINQWISSRGYPEEKANELISFYKENNFSHKALFFCSMMLFKNNEQTLKVLDSIWNMLIEYGVNNDVSRSDQIFVPWCMYDEYSKVKPESIDINEFLSQRLFMFSPKTLCSSYFSRTPRGSDTRWTAPKNTTYLCFDKIVKPFEL